jgi:hypothetical protein
VTRSRHGSRATENLDKYGRRRIRRHVRALYSPMETLLAEQSTADNKMITPSEDLR